MKLKLFLLTVFFVLLTAQFLPLPNDKSTSAEAHYVYSKARVYRIVRGYIAAQCPGSNHTICFERRDPYVYRTKDHCWRWRTDFTHLEGNNPWLFKKWYGSRGMICDGALLQNEEFRS